MEWRNSDFLPWRTITDTSLKAYMLSPKSVCVICLIYWDETDEELQLIRNLSKSSLQKPPHFCGRGSLWERNSMISSTSIQYGCSEASL